MKTLIKALLGASMLMPIAAHAQQDDRRDRRTEMRGERGSRFEARAQQQNEPQAQPQAQAPAPVRPAAQFRGDRTRYGAGVQGSADGQWQGRQRGPSGDPRDQRRAVDRQDVRQQAGGIVRGDGRRDYGNEPRGFGNNARGFGNNARGFDNDRRDYRDDRHDDRQDVGRDRQRGQWDRTRGYAGGNGYGNSYQGNIYNRGNSYNGGGFDQRQGWNRGWRNDRRYDWTRYRSGNSGLYRLPRYDAPYGWGNGYRRFSVGITLSSILWGQDYWIDDPWSYRLPEAYGPYRWVRYYDDALLVDIRSGRVVDTVYDIFY